LAAIHKGGHQKKLHHHQKNEVQVTPDQNEVHVTPDQLK
jgi:hypothetical protein